VFDIGFSELVLVFVIGLIVLGPQRLPVAVKTVVGWIRAIRSLAANVQHELAQELKLQELQDSLKKVEEAGKGTLSPELKQSMEELRKTADSMKRSVQQRRMKRIRFISLPRLNLMCRRLLPSRRRRHLPPQKPSAIGLMRRTHPLPSLQKMNDNHGC